MRQRLEREPFDYQTLRDNMAWPEHEARINTIAALLASCGVRSVLDPAAGDGSLERIADAISPFETITVGDISVPNTDLMRSRYPWWQVLTGDVFQTVQIAAHADAIVLSEILEHLEDPDGLLIAAKAKAKVLIASSPAMRPGQVDPNPEHLWQFDLEGYEAMLRGAGWTPSHHVVLTFPTMYDFQIWVCS